MPKLGEAKSHSFIGHNFGLIAPADGDQAAVAHAAASWSETQSRAVREAATRIAKLEDARASFREALAREINAEAARQLREFSQHQRLALRTLLRAGDFQKRRETARTTHEQSLRLMAEIGVNRERLRTLYAGFRGEAAGIVQRPAVASRLLTRAAVEAAPQPIRDRVKSWDFKASPATADGLTIFQPPFDGWWWKGSWYRAGGNDPQIDIYPDPATGSIGHRSEWGDGNASDFDAFTLDYDTSVSVWYKPPKSGVLDVWIIATCGSAHYDIWLDDEWGWSDSDSRMFSHITANVSPVIDDEDRTQIWQADIAGNPDNASYIDDPFPPGNVQTFHLTTSQAVAGGVWSMLRVGTYEHRFTFLNDVSTRQLMRNRWFVNAIFVQTQ